MVLFPVLFSLCIFKQFSLHNIFLRWQLYRSSCAAPGRNFVNDNYRARLHPGRIEKQVSPAKSFRCDASRQDDAGDE
jgi:hypothetical protein